jgi:asparagine synthase (glutamine-hydrolysing)
MSALYANIPLGPTIEPTATDQAPQLSVSGRGQHQTCAGIEVIADARIDNRRELGARQDESDASIIARAYTRWGTDCARHLIGDFAFVVRDTRGAETEPNVVYLARDPMGVRPLHYHHGTTSHRSPVLRAASEAHAVLPETEREPNRLAIAMFIVGEFEDDGASMYRGVSGLPPGHHAQVDERGVHLERYWHPDVHQRFAAADIEAYAARFAEVFEEAVRCRLVSPKTGIQLSGGLDSASIACQAAALSEDGKPTALHLRFPGMSCDETRYSDAVVARWSLDELNFDGSANVPGPGSAPLATDVLYEPTIACFLPMLQAAKEQGIRTVLTGFGGDQLMDETGGECADALRQGQLREALSIARAQDPGLSSTALLRLWRRGFKRLVPGRVRRAIRPFRRRISEPLSGQMNERVWTTVYQREAIKERRPQRDWTTERYLRLLEGQQTVMPLQQSDRIAAALGIEMRHPFFDVRLVELMLAMPRSVRLRRGVLKAKPLLRRAMRDLLPDEVHARRDAPDDSRFLEDVLQHKHRRYLSSIFENSRLDDLGVVDGGLIRDAISDPELSRGWMRGVALATSMELWIRNTWE